MSRPISRAAFCLPFVGSLFALALGLGACGGDDGPSGPGDQDQDPLPTAPGEPDGAPTSATIGAAGGEVASSDALFTLSIPAGALAADTEIGIQPITNTAWGALGKGYRLTPDGLTFAAPVTLTFTVAEDVAASVAFAFLDVAVQDDAGFWYVLKNETQDEPAGTVTCTTTHFSDYSLIAGVQIEPATASVTVGGTVELHVRYCEFESFSEDADLVALVSHCDEELAPLGSFTNWSVNGVPGGNATSGTVVAAPGTEQHSTYTAPGSVPDANPVAVSVQTTFEGMQALLVSNISVVALGTWTGTSVVDMPDGAKITANITWVYEETNGALVDYYPSGTVTYDPPTDRPCPIVSVTPNTRPLVADDGFLSIDVPGGLYVLVGGSIWMANVCQLCPGDDEIECDETYVGGPWGAADGTVSEDGRTISGVRDVGGGIIMTYHFTKP